jgi:serine protease Do
MLKHNVLWGLFPFTLALPAIWAGSALAQTNLETLGARDPRRTPAVEIFHRWNESIVFLAGPKPVGPNTDVEEYFKGVRGREVVSLGSGFVIHPSGYIIASAHGTQSVITELATLSDGSLLPVELVGLSRQNDLALLKIEPRRALRAVQLAKAGDFLIGEPVIAIGNPAGLMHSCTQGIISAANRATKSRELGGINLYNLLQSDASVHPGSSGGPWFNALGQVIGVTAAIKTGAPNIAFAVPVSAVRQIVPEILDAERRYNLATGLELQLQSPCLVQAVAAGSPAATAGVEAGDILARLDGKPIEDACDFQLALVNRQPNEALKLEWWRKEQLLSGSLVLAARPKPSGEAILRERYGMAAAPLVADKASSMGLRVNRGVVITAIAPGPPYNQMPNAPAAGDVLARINDVRPRDLDHVGFLLDRVKLGEPVHFVLVRMKDHVATRVDMVLTLGKKG